MLKLSFCIIDDKFDSYYISAVSRTDQLETSSSTTTLGDSLEVDQIKITTNNNNLIETFTLYKDHDLRHLKVIETEIQEADQSTEFTCPGEKLDLESDYEIMRSGSDGDQREHFSPEPIYQGPKSNPRSICLDLSVHSSRPKARIRAPSFFPAREKKISNIYDRVHDSSEDRPSKGHDTEKKPTIKRAIKNFVKKFGFNKRGRKHSTKSTSSAHSTSTTTTIKDRGSSRNTNKFQSKNTPLSSSTSSLTTLSKSMTSCSGDVTNIGDVMSHIISPRRFRSKSTGDMCTTTSRTGSVTCCTSSDEYCRCDDGSHAEFQRGQFQSGQFQRGCMCQCQFHQQNLDWDSFQAR